jgi:sugar phosphate isomerase/epimerase
MSCSAEFHPDFFNNVAAIAVVLMFTKVVAHRWRRVERGRWLAALHGLAVVAAAAAVVVSLWATEACSQEQAFHWFAWVGLGAAGAALFVDILIDDVGKAWNWRWSTPRPTTADTSR